MILQHEVTLDECVTDANIHLKGTPSEYYACNFAFYIDRDKVRMGYGCDGLYVNLATGKTYLLYKHFKSECDKLGFDALKTDYKITLDITPETAYNIMIKKPCPKCGNPFFNDMYNL